MFLNIVFQNGNQVAEGEKRLYDAKMGIKLKIVPMEVKQKRCIRKRPE